MITILNNNDVTITTTDKYHFRGDRCYYEIKQKLGAKMAVYIAIGGDVLQASTDARFLKFELSDFFVKMEGGEHLVTIQYSIDGTPSKTITDVKINENGKTMPHRTHGAVTEIEIPKIDVGVPFLVDVFALDEGVLRNGQYEKSVSKMGIYHLNSPNELDDYEISVNYTRPQLIGTLGMMQRTKYHKIHVRRSELCDGAVMVKYRDIDGCLRYAIGKVMDTTTEVNTLEYASTFGEISSQIERKIIGGNKVLRVGFPKVPKGQYIEDMLLSEDVEITDALGEVSISATPTTSSIIRGVTAEDLFVTFKVIEL